MAYDTGIANRLRAEGLNVIEVNDWRTRGSSSFNPIVSVNHHTAGPATGNAPSLRICIYGRSDLPGPLCNVFQARNNDIYVVAAGRANHAGTGSWKGYSGNSRAWGLEVENVGTTAEPWRKDQIDTMVKVHKALIAGRSNPEFVCQHKEWTSRKIDAHSINGASFRSMVAASVQPQPGPVYKLVNTIEVDMILDTYTVEVPTSPAGQANAGCGWVSVPFYKKDIKGVVGPGVRPGADGYYETCEVGLAEQGTETIVSVVGWAPGHSAFVNLTIAR